MPSSLTITVYGGVAGIDSTVGEIGGNKILVETGDRTFFFDFGTQFGVTGLLQRTISLYAAAAAARLPQLGTF